MTVVYIQKEQLNKKLWTDSVDFNTLQLGRDLKRKVPDLMALTDVTVARGYLEYLDANGAPVSRYSNAKTFLEFMTLLSLPAISIEEAKARLKPKVREKKSFCYMA